MSGWSLMVKLHHAPPVMTPAITATHGLELLTSISVRKHVSDTEFVVEPVSTPQPQALN